MNNKFVIFISIVSVLILGIGIVAATSKTPPQLEQTDGAKLEFVGDKTFDWGIIDINGGIVEKIFTIRNAGETDLLMTNVKTSCMCTEAQVIINGEASPAFQMHAQSSWKGTVKPGEEAQIRVVFDPLFHGPTGTGPITRLIGFDTNDRNNATGELTVTAVVAKK
ncbi:MAG: hypothetical protein UU77_C0005G0019 [candidate division WWE3 bacterium GW2011_GWC1_41_7]|jgi:hypothetical protein|uniref:DUF1573 domain-containing protein n=4 Tax=Katanobacteria TaxID=422282 RepID=A0A0G0XCR7_UNCKA|nr:MAG: hypothetical protein UU72_C0001G0052 [candidate division WWE3 bacterium GW2011_GWB1_41_6]KKS21291.1 MAG: hypothetical protein UU77_C0005G0019 [candidate division WWE3 bacterium GW2011_GWC1_41_7]KKS22724.1 MAG: hypothetical protein UU80_C0003G0024 [candidate division WWE3 bacterium GW2011_GWA1_41_8]OGC57717.1 MAG: hypothetical protein A2976_02145 [candidate division WWE3 bacterium RIFCSPLOWO2_01_FULL_41_9]